MKKIEYFFSKYLKGDKYLLALISLLTIFSFLPVYSASSNLIFSKKSNINILSIFYFLFKHISFLILGFFILIIIQFINYKYFYKISVFLLPVVFILLIITMNQGVKIHGINAARWLHVPILNISFQTSNIASLVLFVYCSGFLSKKKNQKITFTNSFFPLLLPILSIIGLIFPNNGSTAIIMFISISIILFIGGYPVINTMRFFLLGLISSIIYIFFTIKWDNHHSFQRVFTWKNRIIEYLIHEENTQIIQSKVAIILGNKLGRGPGKSILKTFLPQSYSDFIYSIIVEEYGIFGGLLLLFIYLLLLFRMMIIATKLKNYFCTLLVFSVGLPIINQALINMGIAVGIFPITGQTLPLISAGGTSILMSFLSFGIILNVSRKIYE
ncbi:FtsW/RodA/SpoVE family cell cycle protein [Blattabacterium cuenoti]|uniref:FtsW/RodA/SpoVE family cell cycle protein n=1 Tax=Blattabacterium cuenoti TaxID=1653831 RepID=UPI00163BF1BC|nr:FtsW/RodA/SpoVE family cell cycle protein [Blattabacterium cuenoti]